MRPKHKIIIREQLDATLRRLSKTLDTPRPSRGWLRAVREALGMSSKQLAGRLGVAPPRITALEKGELSGTVTIKKMQEAANALNCEFYYAFIPQKSLTETVRQQARKLAAHRFRRVSHSMLLESQQLTPSEQKKILEAEVEKIIRDMPKELWEDHG